MGSSERKREASEAKGEWRKEKNGSEDPPLRRQRGALPSAQAGEASPYTSEKRREILHFVQDDKHFVQDDKGRAARKNRG